MYDATARLFASEQRGPDEVQRGDRPAAGVHHVGGQFATATDLHQRDGEGAHERLGQERRLLPEIVESVDALQQAQQHRAGCRHVGMCVF